MDKPSQFPNIFRWLPKRAFELLPQKKRRPVKENPTIGFYFSGTYGDLFQCLDSWNYIRELYPKSILYIKIPLSYYSQIKNQLPGNCFQMNWKNIFLGFDLFFTNAVGVYKNEPLFIGYFFSRNFYGFCYGEEKGRKAQSFSIRLPARYNNNVAIQRDLISLSKKNTKAIWGDLTGDRLSDLHTSAALDVSCSEALFHIGAAGLKEDMGLESFFLKNLEIVKYLEKKCSKVEIITGPDDGDVIDLLRKEKPSHIINQYPLEDLILHTQNFSGLIVCWNSMYAHLCYHIKKPALVLQHNKTPPGYDNGDLHTQLLIKDSDNLDLRPLRTLLDENSL